jgi:hypothetical protein
VEEDGQAVLKVWVGIRLNKLGKPKKNCFQDYKQPM